MIHKINDRSSEPGVTGYLMGESDWTGEPRYAPPELLHGTPASFDAALSTSVWAQPYLSGELSWEEDLAKVGCDAAKKSAVDFVKLLVADLPLDEFIILLVQHQRKRGFDIHFVLLKLHLRTGKQFRFYRDTPADQALLRTWRRKENLSNGWSDPEDPENESLRCRPSRFDKSAVRQAKNAFDPSIVQLVRNGTVTSRPELVALLRREGLSVDEYDDGLEVIYENQTLKLIGGKYAVGFDYKSARLHRATRGERGRAHIDGEIGKLDKKLHKYRLRRAQCYAGEFKGGNRFFNRGAEARMADNGPGFPDQPGATSDSGEAISPHPSGGTPFEDKTVPDNKSVQAHEGLASDPGGSNSRRGADQIFARNGTGNLGAAAGPESGGGTPIAPNSVSSSPRPADPSQSGSFIPVRRQDLGGSGTWNQPTLDNLYGGKSGVGPTGLAHPPQATSNTLTPNNHRDIDQRNFFLFELLAELIECIGPALEEFERIAAPMCSTAKRNRETANGIGINISENIGGESGIEEYKPQVAGGCPEVHCTFGNAVRNFEEITLGLKIEVEAHELDVHPIPQNHIRPLMAGPTGRGQNLEPT